MRIFNKKRIVLLILALITSIIITTITTRNINSNNKIGFKSKSKKLSTVASEYSSLNSRLTTLESGFNNIGLYYYNGPAAVSVPTGSNGSAASHIIASYSNIPAGTYIIIAAGRFDSNATGLRKISLGCDDGNNDYFYKDEISNANSSAITILNVTAFHKFTSSFSCTLDARHTRGSALNVTGRINVVRIK